MSERRIALITGISGQDGSYLSELLLSKGYEVHGIVRRSSTHNLERLQQVYPVSQEVSRDLWLHYADLAGGGLDSLVRDIAPDEVYNLGAQSHVRASFDVPEYTADVTGTGTLRLLEAVRAAGGRARFYQASSSEMFGSTPPPQNESTTFHPRSPYGVAKLFSYWSTVNYREAYGLFATNGILFNHESPRRGEAFVTRRITRAVARIRVGLQKELYLGNVEAVRDWGYAPEYVDAMWRMLQHDVPGDFVIGTGTAGSVKEFAAAAFQHVDLDVDEHLRFDRRHHRPAEVDSLIADASKAQDELGWRATTDWQELARLMVDADCALLDDELAGRLVRVDP